MCGRRAHLSSISLEVGRSSSEPHLLMAAYSMDREEGLALCLLVLTLSGKFIPSLALGPASSGSQSVLKPINLVDPTTIGFLDFPLVDNHCWTSLTTVCKPL